MALALLLMVAGHFAITGQVFDRITDERYNLYTRWVSDYAAKQPEGWWIKGAIYCFCIAIFALTRAQCAHLATSLPGAARALFLQGTATLMIGGLVLVAIFDISPRQVEAVENESLLLASDRQSGTTPPVTTETEEEADSAGSLLSLLNPEGATLREELLRDSAETNTDERALLEYFREMQWDHGQVLAFLRARSASAEPGDSTDDEPAIAAPQLRRISLTTRQKSKERYHRLGFHIFLAGFLLSSLHAAWQDWKARRYPQLPGTALTLTLTVIFASWLFIEKLGLAGIPQRALLALIAVWLLRQAISLNRARRGIVTSTP